MPHGLEADAERLIHEQQRTIIKDAVMPFRMLHISGFLRWLFGEYQCITDVISTSDVYGHDVNHHWWRKVLPY
jgi:hypothetical protein